MDHDLSTLSLGVMALSAVSSASSRFCSRYRSQPAPLHLQEGLLEVVRQPVLGVLPSIGRSIYCGIVAFLCYATAVATLAALGLRMQTSTKLSFERSTAFLLLGGCTEAELWQGIRDSGGGFWRRLLWRLRALLNSSSAGMLCASWLWPLWSTGDAPLPDVVLGASGALIAFALALLVCTGAPSPVKNKTPPPPLRTSSSILGKMLYTFWTPEVGPIVPLFGQITAWR